MACFNDAFSLFAASVWPDDEKAFLVVSTKQQKESFCLSWEHSENAKLGHNVIVCNWNNQMPRPLLLLHGCFITSDKKASHCTWKQTRLPNCNCWQKVDCWDVCQSFSASWGFWHHQFKFKSGKVWLPKFHCKATASIFTLVVSACCINVQRAQAGPPESWQWLHPKVQAIHCGLVMDFDERMQPILQWFLATMQIWKWSCFWTQCKQTNLIKTLCERNSTSST